MAIDSAQFVGQLNDAIPANIDGVYEGAGQIRAVKNALTNTLPNFTTAVNPSSDEINEFFSQPHEFIVGQVTMLAGEAPIPPGWAECNGQIANGFATPDLRDKFIKSAGAETSGTTGGNKEINASEYLSVDGHVLGITEMPSHGHDYVDRYYPEDSAELSSQGATDYESLPTGYNNGVGSSGTDTDNNSVLKITDTTDPRGGNQPHSHGLTDTQAMPNEPEYYVLRFICFVGV